MTLIQIVLTICFGFLLVRFLSNPHSSQVRAWKKIAGILFTILAVVVIALPNSSNDVAHVLGVGRGADLLLYILTVAFIFLCVNLYMNDKRDQKRLVTLTRRVAMLEANIDKKNKARKN